MKYKEIIKLVEADGWYFVRQRGSHKQYKHSLKRGTVTIAGKANDDVPKEMEKSIFHQAGIQR
jgi:predicted RNA binding protein YcfA (HicA-like mRNA interferase family)